MRKMLLDGSWQEGEAALAVRSPYTGQVIDEVPAAGDAQVEAALNAAAAGAADMRALTGYERHNLMMRAAELCEQRSGELAGIISAESGKPISEASTEAARCAHIVRLSAFEGTQQRGDTLPLGSGPAAADKLGFTLREPCGVIVAITPFNFPALLVLFKIAPALAAGNAVILKPATVTPLTALALTEIFLEAGFPPRALQCLTGSGSVVGEKLVSDPRPRKISFTGSHETGLAIARAAGVKRLSLELGSNCPMIVLDDADLDKVAALSATGGYANSGQVCISLQRAIVSKKIYGDFLDALKPAVENIKTGDPADESTRVSTMISVAERERACAWVDEACAAGARAIVGGGGEGAKMEPTLVADARPSMKIFDEEIFAPVVAVTRADSMDEAISLANSTRYGLSASVFTKDVGRAMQFVRAAQSGNVHVNWSPMWRSDLMPYGGYKDSGVGKEGVRSAVEEMTEEKMVVIHGIPSS